jgi:hypothetical protein
VNECPPFIHLRQCNCAYACEPPHPRPFSRLREKGESGTVSSENDRGRFCRDRALACISERKSRQIPPAFLYLLGMQGLPVARCEATSYGTPECVPMLPHDRISRHTDAPRSSPFNMVARTSADPYRSHTIGTPSLCKGEGWDGGARRGVQCSLCGCAHRMLHPHSKKPLCSGRNLAGTCSSNVI